MGFFVKGCLKIVTPLFLVLIVLAEFVRAQDITPDSIVFSPAVTTLSSGGAETLSIQVNAFDAKGDPIIPSAGNPLNVAVYGAPSGVIAPKNTSITSGSTFAFSYNGEVFPNNISVNAWITDQTTGGAAIGQTQILPQNPTCTFGKVNYSVPLTSRVPKELQIKAAIGYLNASSTRGHLKTYTIDTGSLGTLVTASDLPASDGVHALVIGPAGQGVKCYDSSNKAFFGNYYLAPVDISVTRMRFTSTIQTNPLVVLAVNKLCDVDNCKELDTATNCVNEPEIHYMGVGFDRGSTTAGDLFNSPTANAFLHVTDTKNGTDIGPGYVLTKNGGVTLGIRKTMGYNTIDLTPNTNIPGDWNAQPACYTFPDLPTPNQFCGDGLLDVGISQMFTDLPFAQRPSGTFDSNNKVPANLTMNIVMGSPANPAASYTYTTVQPPTSPTGAAPTYSQWIDDSSIFVNTGRNPLNCYNYLFAGQCGQVGFRKVTPSPRGCSDAN